MTDSHHSPHRSRLWPPLLFLSLGALALRLVGIWWGLPDDRHYFSYHPDEIFLLLPSFGFVQGDWNPHFFNYGTLYIYLVGLPAVILGLVPDPSHFPAGLRPLYLEGRLITALLGSATVPLLYLALRPTSRWLALLSAALLAICPLHLITSHYATVDVPATFFLTLALLFTLRGAGRPGAKAAAAAGLAVGLAAATKYNAGLFLIPALLAPAFARRKAAAGWWLALPAAALLGFLIGNPYAASHEFLKGFLFEFHHAREGGTLAFVGAGSGWAYHLTRGLPVALAYPLLAAAVIGVVAAVARPSPAPLLSLLWTAFYLLVIGFSKERFIRYLVPLMPFLCLLAAHGLIWVVAGAKRLRAQATAVLAVVILMLLTALYALAQLIPSVLDARDLAWMQARSDILASTPDATVGFAGSPWYYHPPVSPYNAGAFSRSWFQEWNTTADHPVIVTGWNADRLRQSQPTLFFVSDLEAADLQRLGRTEAIEFLAALDETYSRRITFGDRPLPFSWLAPARASQPPDWLYPTPHITMYYHGPGQ